MVYNCWTGNTTDTTLQWIGFAPNNSFNDNFDYKSFQDTSISIKKFTDVLNATGCTFSTLNIDADSVIGDGMLPKNIGEYRSYLQIPYVKFPKLFNLFKAKAEEVTKYQFELDSDWFSSGNTLWNNEVMIIENFKPSSELGTNVYTIKPWTDTFGFTVSSSGRYISNPKTKQLECIIPEGYSEKYYLYQGGWFKLPNNVCTINPYTITVNIVMQSQVQWAGRLAYILGGDSAHRNDVPITIKYVSDTGTILASATFSNWNLGYLNAGVVSNEGEVIFTANIIMPKVELSYFDCNKFRIEITVDVEDKYELGKFIDISNSPTYAPEYTPTYINFVFKSCDNMLCEVTERKFMSDYKFTLNDLWNNDVLPYDVIVNYCKIHHILIQVDDYSKKIKFIPAWKYFEDFTIEDWTDKIDMSNDY